MTFSFTKTWAGTEVITASDLNGNFSDVASVMNGGIKNQHLSTAANIAADKIADRYTVVKTTLNLVPFSSRAHTTAGTELVIDEMFSLDDGTIQTSEFWVPTADAKIARHEIVANTGQQGHIMAISAYVRSVSSAGSTKWPQLKILLNDTLIGQAITLDTDDAFFRLHANSPFSNPLLGIADKDIIDFVLRAQNDEPGTKISGLYATIYERWSIGS